MNKFPLLQMKKITKHFPGVLALDNVDFTLYEDEVHALVGENGAGKSTLMKILGGAYIADSGEIFLDGKKIEINNPIDGINNGINVVYQELVLAPHLSVVENIFIGQLPKNKFIAIDWKQAKRNADEVLRQLNVDIDVNKSIRDLSVAKQQIIEIARALQRKSRILVLDEPSAVLGKNDIDLLYKIIRQLNKNGIAVIYISHRLEEIFSIADRVTVLRNGKLVSSNQISEVTKETLVKMMIGRDLRTTEKTAYNDYSDKVLLRVENLSKSDWYENVSFQLHAGEIVGFAGLVGSGREGVVKTIAGAMKPDKGRIIVSGKEIKLRSPNHALKNGIGLLPRDRNKEGLFLKRPIFENVTIASLDRYKRLFFLDLNKEKKGVESFMCDLDIRASNANQKVVNLSGGNRQKVVLAKWLGARCKVLIFDEPTRGIDVGAKFEIYQLIKKLSSEGVGIIMVSSEMSEILGLSDKVLVLWRGKLAGTYFGKDATKEKILKTALMGENNNE